VPHTSRAILTGGEGLAKDRLKLRELALSEILGGYIHP
jgi:hypothetical protein